MNLREKNLSIITEYIGINVFKLQKIDMLMLLIALKSQLFILIDEYSKNLDIQGYSWLLKLNRVLLFIDNDYLVDRYGEGKDTASKLALKGEINRFIRDCFQEVGVAKQLTKYQLNLLSLIAYRINDLQKKRRLDKLPYYNMRSYHYTDYIVFQIVGETLDLLRSWNEDMENASYEKNEIQLLVENVLDFLNEFAKDEPYLLQLIDKISDYAHVVNANDEDAPEK